MAIVNVRNGNLHGDIRSAEVADRWDELAPYWDALVQVMDDETRERVVGELAPCEEHEFLARYLEIADTDLVIG